MRRLLLAVPFLIPLCAQAQTTAANPVEPFSYGVRTGTAKNPLVAVLSSVVPSAQAGATQAASPVELFSYGRRVGTKSNPLYINLGSALDAYETSAHAEQTYFPVTGGNVTGVVSAEAGVVVWARSYSALPTSPATDMIIGCSDCYSSSRSTGNTAVGLVVMWNGANWVDGVGNPVLH